MIHAYSDLYLSDARRTLAGSFDHAVYTYGYDLPEYYSIFINSTYSSKFEKGDPFVVSGMSGIELAELIIGMHEKRELDLAPVYRDERGPEYWAGWALAYYQWYSGCTFKALNMEVPIETVLGMYSKYHEMDISQFTDQIEEIRSGQRVHTYLKMYREKMGYSQSELAALSGVPVRTLQQYEQGQKSINKARADYVISLSKTLNVDPGLLLETFHE